MEISHHHKLCEEMRYELMLFLSRVKHRLVEDGCEWNRASAFVLWNCRKSERATHAFEIIGIGARPHPPDVLSAASAAVPEHVGGFEHCQWRFQRVGPDNPARQSVGRCPIIVLHARYFLLGIFYPRQRHLSPSFLTIFRIHFHHTNQTKNELKDKIINIIDK